MRKLSLNTVVAAAAFGIVTSCGVAYHTPSVNPILGSEDKVRVVKITPESVLSANRSTYAPKTLPAAFFQTAGRASASYAASATPDPVVEQTFRPSNLVLRTPPAFEQTPYRIGVGDTLLLATPQAGSTVEQLSGLLAASNSRQGYTVQDDGSIAIPNVGRVSVLGQTLEEAEARLFQALVNNQIDPTFSLEITGFNSKRVAIGGAVANATVVPITLTPLYLDEALGRRRRDCQQRS